MELEQNSNIQKRYFLQNIVVDFHESKKRLKIITNVLYINQN